MSSYLTIVAAQVILNDRLSTEAWDNAEDADKTKALTMATKLIDRLNYLGNKTADAQVLQFPRGGDASVPADILEACTEIALKLLDGFDPELEFENLNMISQGYSNVRSTYDRSRVPEHLGVGIPSAYAWGLLKPYLRDFRTVDMHRAS